MPKQKRQPHAPLDKLTKPRRIYRRLKSVYDMMKHRRNFNIYEQVTVIQISKNRNLKAVEDGYLSSWIARTNFRSAIQILSSRSRSCARSHIVTQQATISA